LIVHLSVSGAGKLTLFCFLVCYFSFTNFQIQLVLGDESSISVGWHKNDEKSSAAGEVKVISFRGQLKCPWTNNFLLNTDELPR
jgi:hypothetical protein